MANWGKVMGVAAIAAAPLVGSSVMGAAPAQAHDVLVATSPEDGSIIRASPSNVELTFNNAVQNRFAQVAVVDSDRQGYQLGTPRVIGSTVTQPINELPDGTYLVSYRVISSDGHPVSGTFSFTVAGSGVAATPAVAIRDHDNDGVGTWRAALLVVAAAAAVAGIVYLVSSGRGRNPSQGGVA
jgi:hypothetical protein